MNRRQKTAGQADGRALATTTLDALKLEALLVLEADPGEDDKGYLLRLALAMARWSAAGALATEGGEQGAYARQSTDWTQAYTRIAKATLPGEVKALERQLGERGARRAALTALKGGG